MLVDGPPRGPTWIKSAATTTGARTRASASPRVAGMHNKKRRACGRCLSVEVQRGLILCRSLAPASRLLSRPALEACSFSRRLRFRSSGPQRWQKLQPGPFAHRPAWAKAQGLQLPSAWPAEPTLGSSSDPGAGARGGGVKGALAAPTAQREIAGGDGVRERSPQPTASASCNMSFFGSPPAAGDCLHTSSSACPPRTLPNTLGVSAQAGVGNATGESSGASSETSSNNNRPMSFEGHVNGGCSRPGGGAMSTSRKVFLTRTPQASLVGISSASGTGRRQSCGTSVLRPLEPRSVGQAAPTTAIARRAQQPGARARE
mmetsp:Transcript_23322/g.66381  ORF Transcript_23322/g.66381 Transcript_23322/m.66381 type:complete len:317 (+) Transcript_23322:253-1203(+)